MTLQLLAGTMVTLLADLTFARKGSVCTVVTVLTFQHGERPEDVVVLDHGGERLVAFRNEIGAAALD